MSSIVLYGFSQAISTSEPEKHAGLWHHTAHILHGYHGCLEPQDGCQNKTEAMSCNKKLNKFCSGIYLWNSELTKHIQRICLVSSEYMYEILNLLNVFN